MHNVYVSESDGSTSADVLKISGKLYSAKMFVAGPNKLLFTNLIQKRPSLTPQHCIQRESGHGGAEVSRKTAQCKDFIAYCYGTSKVPGEYWRMPGHSG